jgi:hypothetical protein
LVKILVRNCGERHSSRRQLPFPNPFATPSGDSPMKKFLIGGVAAAAIFAGGDVEPGYS